MSSITTTLEIMINNLCEDRNLPPIERIESARKRIFDFDYSTPEHIEKEKFKQYFETMFITNYMFAQIGFETVGQFKIKLLSKCYEVMPIYAKLIDSFYLIESENTIINKNITKSGKAINNNTRNENNKQLSEINATSDIKGNSKNINADLPENMINANIISDVGYADNASMTEGESNSNSNSNSNSTFQREQNENLNKIYEEIEKGFNGNIGDIFSSFKKSVSNIFTDLLNEFQELFLLIYY